jgi:oxalate decarboxylase family bicupin protein
MIHPLSPFVFFLGVLTIELSRAGVNMRLGEGVIRELHWHKEAEWAYVLDGEVRITAIDYEGGNFIDDLKKGDLWYFPSGVPHSLQGLGENGTEFLLIFDSGSFSEESTFILTDWLGKQNPTSNTAMIVVPVLS